MVQRMLTWLDDSPFGKSLWLEDIKWAVFPLSESSIIADLEDDQYVLLKLSSPPRTVRFRPEEMVTKLYQMRNLAKPVRGLTEPIKAKKIICEPVKSAIDYPIVRGPARRRHNLGRARPF